MACLASRRADRSRSAVRARARLRVERAHVRGGSGGRAPRLPQRLERQLKWARCHCNVDEADATPLKALHAVLQHLDAIDLGFGLLAWRQRRQTVGCVLAKEGLQLFTFCSLVRERRALAPPFPLSACSRYYNIIYYEVLPQICW